MNQIFKVAYLLLLALLFSCSSDDDSSLEPEIEPIEVSLYSSKISYNVFEPITYKLNYKDTYSAFDLLQCYDSIIWEIPETSRANITEMNDYTRGDYTSITVQWIHHFFTPQIIKSHLLCYQGGEVVCKSTNTIEIKNENDFLNYNWGNTTELIGAIYTDFFEHANNKKGYNYFGTNISYKNNIPSASLYFYPIKEDEEKEKIKLSKDNLYELMTNLYGSSTYDDENKELLNTKYAELFDTIENFEPCYIWLTQTSKIVLGKRENDIYRPYGVYAESR